MRTHPYLIVVDGELGPEALEWLDDLDVGASIRGRSALDGHLDQAALHGVFQRLQLLVLDIVEVRRRCGCVGGESSCVAAELVS